MNSAYENKDFQIQSGGLKTKAYGNLIKQVEDEYQLSWRFCRPKIQENLLRLKLYNNQKRNKDRVGDPLLFTIHQTLLASLYDDRLNVEFIGREEGDEEKAVNLNGLSEFDYDEMGKDELDYIWDWDTLAFGRGLVLFNEFDFQRNVPIPENIDTLTFVRDPRAVSVNGNKLGANAMRFGGREIRLTKSEMRKRGYINLRYLKKGGGSPDSLTEEARQARRDAQGLENTILLENSLTENFEYTVLQWFTHINGEKYVVECANDRQLVVRMQRLEDRSGESAELWPIVDRPCYPMAHDWDGVNVFDILEDKQRFRAELLNVAGDSAKLSAYPMRLFDTEKIHKNVDKNAGFDKWIPVNGNPNNAVANLPKNQLDQQVQYIMDFLDLSAQKATATPESQMGIQSKEDRTLGEIELVASKSGTRYSLTSKVFGWSERAFWRQWYRIYDRDFELGKKMMRLMGVFGPEWKGIQRKDIITENIFGPDIKIESRVVSEAKKVRDYKMLSNYFGIAFGDPTVDKLYGLRKLGKQVMPKDEVERLVPLSIDERRAQAENDKLDSGKRVVPQIDDEHNTHLRIHAAAKDTPSLRAHVQSHEEAIMMQRKNPELIPEQFRQQMQEEKPSMLDKMSVQTSKVPEGATNQ